MIATCKKLVTDIQRGAQPEQKLPEYAALLNRQYNCYATVKGSMNYYTMKEVCEEQEQKDCDICTCFAALTDLLKTHLLERKTVEEPALEKIDALRTNVEYKMHILTAYTDAYEIYEYVLNRVEGAVCNTIEKTDAKGLSEKMFAYVFSENDTVVINSKLQLLMAQLPVRMTKSKFYDIVSSTLNIYEGGDTSSVDEFIDMLRSAVLIKKPEGFDTEYPFLYQIYSELAQADFATLTKEAFEDITARLNQAAAFISNEVSAYMLLQEVINDVYTILLTVDGAYEKNQQEVLGYAASVRIIKSCMQAETIEQLSESVMDDFFTMEGVQERVYESVMILETVFDDIRVGKKELLAQYDCLSLFERLDKAGKLLSTSLFIDLHKAGGQAELADHEYIAKKKEMLLAELAEVFGTVKKPVCRSMMAKLLAAMPIFMNTQQEIRDYFDYVIENCRDDSELMACNHIVCEMIEE